MSNQFPHPFKFVITEYRKMRAKLPREVSNIAVAEFKQNFVLEGYRGANGNTWWKKRKHDTTKSRGRKILSGTGRLKRGIQPEPTFDKARVINAVPYAKAHNEGFKGTEHVRSYYRNRTRKTRIGSGRFSIKTHKEGHRTVTQVTGRIKVKAHRRKMILPARPFMITTEPLLNNIDKHILNKLTDIWDKAPDK